MIIIVFGYVVICLRTSSDTQLKIASLLSLLFSFVMCFVVVGILIKAYSNYHAFYSFIFIVAFNHDFTVILHSALNRSF